MVKADEDALAAYQAKRDATTLTADQCAAAMYNATRRYRDEITGANRNFREMVANVFEAMRNAQERLRAELDAAKGAFDETCKNILEDL
jgi:DNA-binding ferritin-like protein